METYKAEIVSNKLGNCRKYTSMGNWSITHQPLADEVGKNLRRYKGIESLSDDKVDWLISHSRNNYLSSLYDVPQACCWIPGTQQWTWRLHPGSWNGWYLLTFVSHKWRTHPLRCQRNSHNYGSNIRLWKKYPIPQTRHRTGHILGPWCPTPETSQCLGNKIQPLKQS